MLKKSTKLIILGSSIVVLTSIVFSAVLYKENVNKVQKQKIENSILVSKISAKKVADAKILAKKIADEKIRVAKLNEGMTESEALALAYKLVPGYNWKLSDGTEVPNDNKYFQFKMFDLKWNDVGADSYLAIDKSTGVAYNHYSDNTMVRVPGSVPTQQTVTNPVENTGVYDKAYAPKNIIVKSEPCVSSVTLETIKTGTMIKVYGGVPIGTDQGNFSGAQQYGWSKIMYNNSDAWVKTGDLTFADSYNWAPGIKEKFEDDIVKQGYANNKSSIRYSREVGGPYIPKGEGVYRVYTDVSGANPVVNVDVKTGWYHG